MTPLEKFCWIPIYCCGRRSGQIVCHRRYARLARRRRLNLSLAWPACGKSPSNAGRAPDFTVDERVLRRALLDHGYEELPILSQHVGDP